MAEELLIPDEILTRKEKYEIVLPQILALIEGEKDLIANLANISSALKECFNFFWVGFYLVKGEQLVLGPFQGPVACTRIAYGKGVCGTAWKQKQTIIVEDVDKFPGHIACSSASRSEIVVPVLNNDLVTMVLDIDSRELADFNEVDQYYLEKIIAPITGLV